MMIFLDQQQSEVLREILQRSVRELRIEAARADSHDYRELLYERERVVDLLLTKLDGEPATPSPRV